MADNPEFNKVDSEVSSFNGDDDDVFDAFLVLLPPGVRGERKPLLPPRLLRLGVSRPFGLSAEIPPPLLLLLRRLIRLTGLSGLLQSRTLMLS